MEKGVGASGTCAVVVTLFYCFFDWLWPTAAHTCCIALRHAVQMLISIAMATIAALPPPPPPLLLLMAG
jgi:hypothetical protein